MSIQKNKPEQIVTVPSPANETTFTAPGFDVDSLTETGTKNRSVHDRLQPDRAA